MKPVTKFRQGGSENRTGQLAGEHQALKPMKTTMKLATVITLLTMGLVTTSWASPRSKLSYDGPGTMSPSNYRSASSHADHVWFKHVGPRSKM